MNAYDKLIREDQRLVILQVLNEDADYSHNEHVIRSALRAVGHGMSRDKLHTEFAWLEEQGLVSVSEAVGLKVVTLKSRGRDVAIGETVVPGVKRPEPEL